MPSKSLAVVQHAANATSYIVQPQCPSVPSRTKPISHGDHNRCRRKPDGRINRHPCHSIRIIIIWSRPCRNNLRRDVKDIARHVVSSMVVSWRQQRKTGQRPQGSRRRYVRATGEPVVYRCFRGREERTSSERRRPGRVLPPESLSHVIFIDRTGR